MRNVRAAQEVDPRSASTKQLLRDHGMGEKESMFERIAVDVTSTSVLRSMIMLL